MNTEYIENFNAERAHRWLGLEPDNDEARMFYAMVGMKQTEILRRLGFDGAIPYGIYAWTRGEWRPYAPTPMYAALHNALAPVTVSVDLDDRNKTAGQELSVPVWVINDTNDSLTADLTCRVCAANPDFSPLSPAVAASKKAFAQPVRLAPRSRRAFAVTIALPGKPGPCWIAAVLSPKGREAVISQREIALHPDNAIPATVAGRTYRVIGADSTALAWFKERGIKVLDGIPYGRGKPDSDMLIVWENVQYSRRNLHIAPMIGAYLGAGRRVLMMQQHGWRATDWYWGAPGLPEGPNPEYTVVAQRCGLALREKTAGDEAIWRDLDRQSIMGWNGLDNAVCRDALATLPSFDRIPATHSSTGQMPLNAGTIVIEGESPVSSNLVVDFPDPRHAMKKDGRLVAREFDRFRGGKASLLSTKAPPADAYSAAYEFTAPSPMDGVVWVFEQGRAWASPFSWRIDQGPWTLASTDIPAQNWESMAADGPTFAWSRLGTNKLSAGKHRLEIKVTAPKSDGHFLLSQDCFMIAPALPAAEILAKSGDGGTVLARAKIDKGELLVTQLLLAQRLSKKSRCHDPMAEKVMLNLMAY